MKKKPPMQWLCGLALALWCAKTSFDLAAVTARRNLGAGAAPACVSADEFAVAMTLISELTAVWDMVSQ